MGKPFSFREADSPAVTFPSEREGPDLREAREVERWREARQRMREREALFKL